MSMDFSMALAEIKAGSRVARKGWNGKGMYVRLEPRRVTEAGLRFAAHLVMNTPDDTFVPWVTSQADVLAEDWEVC